MYPPKGLLTQGQGAGRCRVAGNRLTIPCAPFGDWRADGRKSRLTVQKLFDTNTHDHPHFFWEDEAPFSVDAPF